MERDCTKVVLLRRFLAWIPGDHYAALRAAPIMQNVAQQIRSLAGTFPPCVVFAVLKWMTSALCTTARFHNDIDECPLCGTFCGDRIEHIVLCSCFYKFSETFWGFPVSCNRLIVTTLEIQGVPLTFDHFCTIALHLYAGLKVYNHARTNGRVSYSLYHGFLVQLSARSPLVGQHVTSHRQLPEVAAPG